MPQLPRLTEEGHDHEAPQDDDSADSSAGSSGYHSTKSCPVSPHRTDQVRIYAGADEVQMQT